MDDIATGDTSADVAYRWTIRVLYTVAIALNVYLLLETVVDDAEVELLRAKGKRLWDQALRPLHIDRLVKQQTGPLLWEAMQIVTTVPPADE